MRRGGGNQKGGQFERGICRELSLWVTHGERRDVFWRSAMSGGRATVMNRKSGNVDVRQSGDIVSVSPEGHVLTDHYFVECKHRKDLDFAAFFTMGAGSLAIFWRKACREAASYGKRPMMIACQNRYPTLMIVQHTDPSPHIIFPTDVDIIQVELGEWLQGCSVWCTIYVFDQIIRSTFHARNSHRRSSTRRQPLERIPPPIHGKATGHRKKIWKRPVDDPR